MHETKLVGGLYPAEVHELGPREREAVSKLRWLVASGRVDPRSATGGRLYAMTPAELAVALKNGSRSVVPPG